MNCRLVILFVLTFFSCLIYGASENKLLPFKVSAKAYILMDQKTGMVIAQSHAHELFYPASITKILTALLAIEKGEPLDTKIKLSKRAAYSIEPGSSSIGLKPDEVVSLESLMYALMLRSANEAGNAIAEWVAGNNDIFSGQMTIKCQQIASGKSFFKNPHGLPDKGHKTTAFDMARITREAMKHPFFREVVATRAYAFPSTNKHTHKERGILKNKNLMLNSRSQFYFKNCIGVKGGFTQSALHTFVASAKEGDKEVISVVLKEPSKETMYKDLIKILEWGLLQYEVKIWKASANKPIVIESADDSLQSRIDYVWEDVLPVGFDLSELTWHYDMHHLELPIDENRVIGRVTPVYKDVKFKSADVLSANMVFKKYSRQDIEHMIQENPKSMYAIVISMAVFLGYIMFKTAKNHSSGAF